MLFVVFHKQFCLGVANLRHFLDTSFLVGHGDTVTQKTPKPVMAIGKVRHVSCGSAHTLILSSDGQKVWSCGAGDGGKLGHGNTSRILTPKV